tara:strand:+ start:640 stop:843 length:204 start_codon:yes stop_codon:yes gene_type:complete
MDERNLNFEIGDLVEWTELIGDGLLVKDRGLGIVVKKVGNFYKVHRAIKQDIINFNINEIKKINENV